jgi:hypothetical protein
MIKDFDAAFIEFGLARDYPSAAQDEPDGLAPPGTQPGDVLMAAGPSDTVTDAGPGVRTGRSGVQLRPPSMRDITEPAMGMADMFAATGKGLVQGFAGLPGDVEALTYGIKEIFNRGAGEGKLNAFLRGFQSGTVLPKTEEVKKWLDQNIGTVGGGKVPYESIGEVVAPGGQIKAVKAGAAGVKALVKETGSQLDRAMMEGTGPLSGLVSQGARPLFSVDPTRPNVVSTRLPTAVKRTEDPLANQLTIDLNAVKADPNAFAVNMGLIRQYPNFASKARNPDRQAEDFITEVKNNLLYLHDKVPDATRQRSKLWYDGARTIAERFSSNYNLPDQAVSGVLAVLSPQKDWFMNVSLGERVLDIATKQQSTRWDASMDAMANTIFGKEQYASMLNDIRGKTLSELKDPGLKAMWLRTYDQAKNPRQHQIVSPEGDFVGVRMNQDGKSPTKTGWGSLNEIGKAIVILDDPRIETISLNLGDAHKVRNFYNNIYAPNDPAGHVTIDTHAVAAGLLRPLSGNSREVKHNFGGGPKGERGTSDSKITGVKGTYGLYAEAYRRAAQERGILPREMQSITWEAVRGLYPDTFKSQAKNVDQIDGIWLQYRKGKMSLEEARDEVFRIAGGINPPEWESAGLRSGSAQEVQPANYSGELPGAGLPGGSAGGSGRNQPAAGNPSSVTGSRQAPQSGVK